jgi:hypothetical protein
MRFLIFPLAVTAIVACSSSSSSGGGASSDTGAACYGQCDAQSKATNCQAGGITDSQCHQLCDELIPRLTADCQAKAKAAWTCGSSTTWACAQGGNLPLEQGSACSAQNQAYAACSSGAQDAGGG